MPKSRPEIKAAVMAKVEAVVDKALAEAEQGERLTLTRIEEIVLEARHEVSVELTAVLVEGESGQVIPGPRCAQCGQEIARILATNLAVSKGFTM